MNATAEMIHAAAVPSIHLPILRDRIDTLNRKAVKLGKPALTLTVKGVESREVIIHREGRPGIKITAEYTLLEIAGDRPILAGWALAGVKTRMDNGEMMLREVPGVSIPVEYRGQSYDCEHCHLNRRRSELVIIHNVETGEWKQVGKSCLSDFLGGASVQSYLDYWAIYSHAIESANGEGEECGYRGGKDRECFDSALFLALTATAIRTMGWVSAAKAREICQSGGFAFPTYGAVCSALRNHSTDDKKLRRQLENDMDESDGADATAALVWARNLSPKDASGYLYNLGVAARQECVTMETAGLMASAITAYKRAQESEAERKAREAMTNAAPVVRSHIGTVGKREVLTLTVKTLRTFDSDYGVRTLVRMEDPAGNVVVWWTGEAPEWAREGNQVKVKATVKAHDDYKGTPQTTITRASLA